MADTLSSLNFTFVVRSAPRSGPSSSDAWNDSFLELSTDLATISTEWNNKLVPIMDGLPGGDLDANVNAFENGLDARSIWVNGDITSSNTDLTFYDTVNGRPVTIEEALVDLYQHVTTQIDQATDVIIEASSGITTDQKSRIGANIFDSGASSSSSSLDGKSEINRQNITQLARDVYGSGYVLPGTGTAQLDNSVMAMVDALLELHNGDWSNDVSLNHTGAFSATQQDIATSAPGNDTYSGSPVYLRDDLNQIRAEIKELKGTTGWLTDLSFLYASGPNSLEELLASTVGSASKSASNPWGYRYDNIDGLVSRLDAIRDFTGQDSHTDDTPTYSGTNYISNGDNLEYAIGQLDIELNSISTAIASHTTQLGALLTFVGQDIISDSTPDYSSTSFIADSDPLETAIGKLDTQIGVNQGNIATQSGHLNSLLLFTGQDNASDSTPTYNSIYFVNNSDPLETAIGKLDAELNNQNIESVLYSGYINALSTFTGQDSLSDITPTYTSNNYIANNDPLETAIGKLDTQIGAIGGHSTLLGLLGDDHPQYLRSDGDTMSGVLNMNSNTIDDIATPTTTSQATTKGYVDDHPLFLHNTGDTMSGVLNMAGNTIDDVATPTTTYQAATKGYVDTNTASITSTLQDVYDNDRFVSFSGGPIVLDGADNQALTITSTSGIGTTESGLLHVDMTQGDDDQFAVYIGHDFKGKTGNALNIVADNTDFSEDTITTRGINVEVHKKESVNASFMLAGGWNHGVFKRNATVEGQWDKLYTLSLDHISQIHGSGQDNIWIVGEYIDQTPYIAQSTDGGVTLTRREDPLITEEIASCVLAISLTEVYVLTTPNDSYGGEFFKWDGTSWAKLAGPDFGSGSNIRWPRGLCTDGSMLAFGEDDSIRYSNDGGYTWNKEIILSNHNDISLTYDSYNDEFVAVFSTAHFTGGFWVYRGTPGVGWNLVTKLKEGETTAIGDFGGVQCVWVDNSGNIYTIFRLTGSNERYLAYNVDTTPVYELLDTGGVVGPWAIHGLSSSEVYTGESTSTVSRWDGSSVTHEEADSPEYIRTLYGAGTSSDSSIYVGTRVSFTGSTTGSRSVAYDVGDNASHAIYAESGDIELTQGIISLGTPSTTVSGLADRGQLYVDTVYDNLELFFLNEDGENAQITDSGSITGYRKDEFIFTSSGAGDAWKPIKLSISGQIDPTFIDRNDFIIKDGINSVDLLTITGSVSSTETVEGEHLHSTDDITASGQLIVEQDIEAHADIEVTDSGHGLILRSPNGSRFRLTVDDGGTLSTTAI